jgi:hypothetical protein
MNNDWTGQINALVEWLRPVIATLSDAELSQIASAARRLASLAEGVQEDRAYAASEAEDSEEERRILEGLGLRS